MTRYFFFSLLVLVFTTSSVLAQAVIYTTADHPVQESEPGVVVLVLEDVAELERSLFPSLSDDPLQAEQQARLRMQQPDWKAQEARLTRAYQAQMDARAAGVTRLPAVVFDNQSVVYGTTDVVLARKIRDAGQEAKP